MEIRLHYDSLLADISREFNSKFPYLKLEFFEAPASPGGTYTAKDLLPARKITLGEIASFQHPGYLKISPRQSVETLEQFFKKYFGLHVQVFRCAGTCWIQTTNTDSWTLEEQNRKGEEASHAFEQKCEIDDYHEQE
jgi:hypothetical protein